MPKPLPRSIPGTLPVHAQGVTPDSVQSEVGDDKERPRRNDLATASGLANRCLLAEPTRELPHRCFDLTLSATTPYGVGVSRARARRVTAVPVPSA